MSSIVLVNLREKERKILAGTRRVGPGPADGPPQSRNSEICETCGLVENWLNRRMLKEISDEKKRRKKAKTIAAYFNAEETPGHGKIHVHGQRIGAKKLQELGIKLEFLEGDQGLQNDVLTAYHLMTLIFETTNSLKFVASDGGKMWVKQQQQRQQQKIIIPAPLPGPQQEPSNPASELAS